MNCDKCHVYYDHAGDEIPIRCEHGWLVGACPECEKKVRA
jgi:hypothetical protein